MNQECRPTNKAGERNVLCPYYNDCLDHAIARSWKGWDCSSCEHKMNQQTITDFPLTSGDSFPQYDFPADFFSEV